jgi:tight adherence protein B
MMGFVVLTFCLVLGIIFGSYYAFVLRPELRDQHALRKRLRGSVAAEPAPMGTLERPAERLSGVQALNVVLSRTTGISGPLERLITQSGLKLTVGTLLLASAFLGCVTYLVVKWLTYYTYLGLAAAPLGAMVPFVVVHAARTKRLRLFEEQFPEAIGLLARALRAGHAFSTGLTMVADEIPAPVGTEFKLVHDRQNFGMPLGDALKGLADRVPVLDARFFVTAVLTQRETGGNLAEVLDNLASVIRDRFRLKRQVRVVTAHGRITGWILAALPPTLAGVLCFVSPGHMTMLVTDPLGIQMVVVAGVLQVSGTLIIRKLVNVPY